MTAKIATANRLGDGLVVYLTQDGAWTHRIADAEVARDAHGDSALLARAEAREQATRVVGAYLMDVTWEAGLVSPISNREFIRAFGPSVREE
jgi:Protein of unknown function (DUF2849)